MAQTVSRRSIVYDILFEVQKGKKSVKQAESDLKKLGKTAEKTGTQLTGLGKQIAGAFALTEVVRQVSRISQEAFELGIRAEGVTLAFNKLNRPDLLKNLRAATKGTVEDLTLMQAAVRADKFQIPLQNLQKFFKFAAIRARETGQEVNFLVDSIIDGIGRKSPLILDNLGINLQAIQKETKKVGDFATAVSNIIERDIGGKATAAVQLHADKVDQLRTTYRNTLQDVGKGLLLLATDTGLVFKSLIKSGLNPTQLALQLTKNIAEDAIESITRLASLQGFGPKLQESLEQFDLFLDPTNLQKFQFGIDNLRIEIAKMAAGEKGSVSTLNQGLNTLKEKLEDTKDPLSLSADETRRYTETINELALAIANLTKIQVDASTQTVEAIGSEAITRANNSESIKMADEVQKISTERLDELTRHRISLTEDEKEAVISLANSTSSIFSGLAQLAGENLQAQIGLGVAQILINQAVAIANAIAAVKTATSPVEYIAGVAATVAATFSAFTQIDSFVNNAKAAAARAQEFEAQQFSEGEVDIHRQGEKRGKDSIPAMIMPGESVMTTQETAQHKPILEAIREGTLEDLIHSNYVDPALAMQGMKHVKEDSKELDYTRNFKKQLGATELGLLGTKHMVGLLTDIKKNTSGHDFSKKYRR